MNIRIRISEPIHKTHDHKINDKTITENKLKQRNP